MPQRKLLGPPFFIKVWQAVQKIPPGRVSTYVVIARSIGSPRSARAAGNALNKNPYRSVPCHRVIRSDGRAGGYAHGTREKIKLLRREGIKIFSDQKVSYSQILKNLRIAKH